MGSHAAGAGALSKGQRNSGGSVQRRDSTEDILTLQPGQCAGQECQAPAFPERCHGGKQQKSWPKLAYVQRNRQASVQGGMLTESSAMPAGLGFPSFYSAGLLLSSGAIPPAAAGRTAGKKGESEQCSQLGCLSDPHHPQHRQELWRKDQGRVLASQPWLCHPLAL